MRTLPNHILFGSILAASVGRSCIFYLSGAFWEYIFNLLIVAFDLNELFLPSVFPLITLLGFNEEFEWPPFWNFLALCLFALCSEVYFFPIVDYNIIYITIMVLHFNIFIFKITKYNSLHNFYLSHSQSSQSHFHH